MTDEMPTNAKKPGVYKTQDFEAYEYVDGPAQYLTRLFRSWRTRAAIP